MSDNIELFEDLNRRLADIVSELADVEGELKKLMANNPKQLKRVYWAIRIRLLFPEKKKRSIKDDFYYCGGPPHGEGMIGFDLRTELLESQVPLALKQVKEHCAIRFGHKEYEVKPVKVKVYARAV